jgi:hypothetical protein
VSEYERIELAEATVQLRLLAIWLAEATSLDRYEVASDLAARIAQHLTTIRRSLARVT